MHQEWTNFNFRFMEPLTSRVPMMVIEDNHEIEPQVDGITFQSYLTRFAIPSEESFQQQFLLLLQCWRNTLYYAWSLCRLQHNWYMTKWYMTKSCITLCNLVTVQRRAMYPAEGWFITFIFWHCFDISSPFQALSIRGWWMTCIEWIAV